MSARDHTPLHLINLPPRVSDETFDGATGECIRALISQRIERFHRPLDQRPAARQIRLHPLRMPLRPARRAHLVEQFPDLAGQMTPLTPAAHPVPRSTPPRLPHQAAHRIPQQVDVRRIVHIGFDHERVTPPAQWLARLLFATLCPHVTIRRLTADNNSGVNNETLTSTVWYT